MLIIIVTTITTTGKLKSEWWWWRSSSWLWHDNHYQFFQSIFHEILNQDNEQDWATNQSDLMFKQEHQELDSQCFMSNIIVIINNDYPPKSKMRKFSSNLITYNGCHSFITTDNEINQKKKIALPNRIESNQIKQERSNHTYTSVSQSSSSSTATTFDWFVW